MKIFSAPKNIQVLKFFSIASFIGRYSSRPLLSRGFTLVELIIVIAILGILAVGLLVAIDPAEQLSKARDNNRRRAAVEYLGAMSRYYAIQSSYPWGAGSALTWVSGSGNNNILFSAGELAAKYTAQLLVAPYTGANGLSLVVSNASIGRMRVCFLPESKGIEQELAAKYSSDLQTTTCTKPNCYFCAE